MLDATGSVSSELNLRLGLARSDVKNLERVWKHANIPQHRKILIFDTCVGSQLLYCLHTAWLNKAELRKLDGFHARCQRKILGIPHPCISRVLNCHVFQAGQMSAIFENIDLPAADAFPQGDDASSQ